MRCDHRPGIVRRSRRFLAAVATSAMPAILPTAMPSAALATIIALGGAANPTAARAEWHADLPTAVSASRISGKPVLAVFVASWDSASPSETAELLANPEVDAVVSACFEPVQLDVDAHEQLTRQLTVEHIPSAVVLDADQQPLATFECPPTPAEFVAAAARAAQVAAASGLPADQTEPVASPARMAAGGKSGKGQANLAVTSKVEQLSKFAGNARNNPGRPSRFAPALDTAFVETPIESATSGHDTPTSYTPALPRMPTTWPAEEPVASGLAGLQPTVPPSTPATPAPATQAEQPSIQPAPAATSPWLAGDPAPTAAQPESTATITDGGEAAAGRPQANTEAKPSSFWTAIQKPWSIFAGDDRNPTVEPPAPPATMPPARPQSPAAVVASGRLAATQNIPTTMPLGMEGYCPVTVVERGTWVEGRPQWGARHRGRTYLFAGPEQQQAFMADPDRYAPALSGDDPVLAFQSGRSEPGRRAYGVTYQSRMYLFSSPETRAAFSADPDRYTSRVLIAEGRVPVDGVRRF